MSKNTPTTQYLDFNTDKWNITDSITYTKEFDKFYSEPEVEIVITNLSIVKTVESNTVQVANIIAIPIQVIKKKPNLQKIIPYYSYKFDIEGGQVTINLSYNPRKNTLAAAFEFAASQSS